MFVNSILLVYLNLFFLYIHVYGDECEFLNMCKCTNFPLFALIDVDYISKPRSPLNQDLFCAYSSEYTDETKLTTFDQFKYFNYRFRTLTFANYPFIPTRAFRFVHFETQSVKQTHKTNNRNVITFVNVERTESDIFEELSLPDSHDQLIVSFLNSPSLNYVNGGLAKLNCYQLKLFNTNPNVPIAFFNNTIYIHHLIIENPSFSGFRPSKQAVHFNISKIEIKDISVRHLQGKHFPFVFNSVNELILENHHVQGGFRSFHNRELAQSFPKIRSLKLFSRSIQHITDRMFEHFNQLEYLVLNGITTIENEAFFNLYHLKVLNLGKNILRLDPYAFIHMNTNLLLLNESIDFKLNDDKHFCVFAQFSPLTNLKTFVKFTKTIDKCSCTIRYLYRHLDKSLMSMTPDCYSNSSLYILGQEERLCYFEQRLLECHVLPDEGITIYGQNYNTSYFYDKQIWKQRKQFNILYQYRLYIIISSIVLGLFLCFSIWIIRKNKQGNRSAYKHLNRLLNRKRLSRNDNVTMDIVYHRTNGEQDLIASTIPISTKV